MHESKSKLFGVVLVLAILVAGYFLYKQQSQLSPSPVSVPSTQEVKGESVTSTSQTSSSITSTEYTKKNSTKHLAISRANIIWFTNYERVKAGLNPLREVSSLDNSSFKKNEDMFAFQYFDHTRKSNPSTGFDTFIDQEKYSFIKIGENLAMGDFSSSAEIVTAWMKSPAHRKNILDPNYKEIGVSVQYGTMNSKEVLLATQHFGNPRSSCPTVSQSSQEAIGGLKTTVVQLQEAIATQQKDITSEHALLDPNYESLVVRYNQLVETYNTTIAELGRLVKSYNNQVARFDNCVRGK